eukprot:TRINITY_DN12895_c0_g2_i1.p1 TRINITY_DN12895_c0_g2~~TRINITY_DN12895_c0_g2_i1.p1  ORF type:complete len:1270 (+),score=170.75 TRINITY_DN12895_c0_g2_i1:22-3810(+)
MLFSVPILSVLVLVVLICGFASGSAELSWAPLPASGAAPDPRNKCGFALVYNQSNLGDTGLNLVIYGGQTAASSWVADFRTFSLTRKYWRQVPVLSGVRPPALRDHRLVVLPDKPEQLILLGGSSSAGVSASLWRFSFTTLAWREESQPTIPPRERYCAVVLSGGWHVLFGVGQSGDLLDDHWRLNSGATSAPWIELERGPAPRRTFGCATINSTALAVTGGVIADNTQPADLWIYRYDAAAVSGAWNLIIADGSSAAAGRTYFAMAGVGGTAVFMGGGFDRVAGKYMSDWWFADLLLPNATWQRATSYMGNAPALTNMICADDLVGNGTYCFAGDRGLSDTRNSVSRFGTLSSLRWETLFSGTRFSTPPSRVYHQVALVNTFVVIGFGQNSNSAYLSDLWTWDLVRYRWDSVSFTAEGPGPRRSPVMLADGASLIVFGGVDDLRAYGDLWACVLTEHVIPLSLGSANGSSSVTWQEVEKTTPWPPNRHSAAAAVVGFAVYMYSGMTFAGVAITDLWRLDLISQKWQELASKGMPAGRINFAYCTLHYPTIRLAVFGGKLWELWLYDPSANSWTQVQNITDPEKNIVQDYWWPMLGGEGQLLAMFGGMRRTVMRQTNLFATFSLDPLPGEQVTAVREYDARLLPRFGNQAIAAGGNVVTFGGQLGRAAIAVPSGMLDELWAWAMPWSTESCGSGKASITPQCAPCSPGYVRSYNASGVCTPCPAGTYESASVCVACPTRTANAIPGASSAKQCLPCSGGSYGPSPGLSSCLACPAGYYCPPYAQAPQAQGAQVVAALGHVKPEPLPPNKLPKFAWIIVGCIAGVGVVGFGVLYLCAGPRRAFFSAIDIFSRKHFVPEHEAVRNRPTSHGGIFTAFTITIALALTNLLVFLFIWQDINTIETLQTLSRSHMTVVASRLAVRIQLFGSNACSKSCAAVALAGLQVADVTVTCHRPNDSDDCWLEFGTTDAALTGTAATLRFSFESGSSANAINVSATVTTGIMATVDRLYRVMVPPEGRLFRGPQPNTIGLLLYPTVFDDLGGHKTTGFHLDHVDATLGSVVDVNAFPYTRGVLVEIAISRAQSMIAVDVSRKGNVLGLAGQASGILSGVAGVFAFLMWLAERSKHRNRSIAATAVVAKTKPDYESAASTANSSGSNRSGTVVDTELAKIRLPNDLPHVHEAFATVSATPAPTISPPRSPPKITLRDFMVPPLPDEDEDGLLTAVSCSNPSVSLGQNGHVVPRRTYATRVQKNTLETWPTVAFT